MTLSSVIHLLRAEAHMTQEQLAVVLGVPPQAVQDWETGTKMPETENLVILSKYFNVSLDELVLSRDDTVHKHRRFRRLRPMYENLHPWESYAAGLRVEYQQSMDEGLDVEKYADVFDATFRLPGGEVREKLADVLFNAVSYAPMRENYPYTEPSDLEQILPLRGDEVPLPPPDEASLAAKIHGAWMGRICGCMLGKTVEGMRTDELIPFLRESDNYPMHRYICRADVPADAESRFRFDFSKRNFADEIDGMPVDDDTNYMVLAQELIERCGRDFTPQDVSRMWLELQKKDAYCTAERVAFCNFVRGYEPPYSALYKNPYREYIGAQIRGDYFGFINPGNPAAAAEMAWRDASVSHVKNGIYGEMWAAAMIAAAAVTADMETVIRAGMAQIPKTSRLFRDLTAVLEAYSLGEPQQECFAMIHSRYDENTGYGWCHTNPNAMVVAASLLYSGGDYARAICMAVETGFDTDCNGATVGSVIGMAYGPEAIGQCWTEPIRDTLHTTVFGVGTVRISERAEMTMRHVRL